MAICSPGFAGYPDELNVTAKDATTFEFVLTAPCAYIEDLMAFPTFYPGEAGCR